MKLIDIANKINKSKENEDWVDISVIGEEFGLNIYSYGNNEKDRLKSYWIGNWYCTDSWVGYKMYFFDGEPVGISSQIGRKCNEEFEWFSNELALKVMNYIISLSVDEISFSLCDINDDIGDGYKISFNANILSHHKNNVSLNGEPVRIIERIRETPDYGIDQILKVKLSNGDFIDVNIEKLDFNFHINE